MGILNVTPDSFFAGSRVNNEADILSKAEAMIAAGATILDIGGYSSRPGATDISEEEEIKRVTGPISAIRDQFPEVLISIDTFHSRVAQAAVEAGAAIVNDISGGQIDPDMIPTVADLNCPYILMHMRGTPQNMSKNTNYEYLVKDLIKYFSERIALAKAAGIKDIILDPGFGFSKKVDQNYELLNKLELLHVLEHPVLVGVSRKSMIYKTLNCSPEDSLNGTTVLNTISLMKGAQILRVHDVKEAVEAVTLIEKLRV
ncbi:MAG: dihydropteroate synthase [Crocinitomicaceae bacterium]